MMPKVCDEDILFIIISSPPLLSPPTSHLAVTVCSFNIPKQQSAQDSLVQHLPYSMATLLTANNTTHNAREHAAHGNTRTRNARSTAHRSTQHRHTRGTTPIIPFNLYTSHLRSPLPISLSSTVLSSPSSCSSSPPISLSFQSSWASTNLSSSPSLFHVFVLC